MIVKSEGRIPLKIWSNEEDFNAIEQGLHLANLPFAFKQVCLMPDFHLGMGMPIGGVLATKGVIIPNAVGSDAGCGMCAFNTGIKEFTIDNLKNILGKIRKTIPVGMNRRTVSCEDNEMPKSQLGNICKEQYDSSKKSLGTLGSGNHFQEIQKDEDGNLWIMIHSGSRNLGKQVNDFYNKKAIELNERWFSGVPKEWQLSFLPIEDKLAQDYLIEMNYCLEFAYLNRKKMMLEILGFVDEEFSGDLDFSKEKQESLINIHHNFVAKENHFGSNVWVHRKGATQAKTGQIGIIPGSQGTKSYIVEGLGNVDSFMSCSHGAGRKMSRSAAQKNLNLADEREKLDSQGILHAIRGKDDLDEASGAYKDIEDVMNSQKDLVKIIHTLQPLAVVKG